MGVLAGMFLSFPYSPLWLPGTIGSESPLPFYRVGGSIETQKKNRAIREIRAKKHRYGIMKQPPNHSFPLITHYVIEGAEMYKMKTIQCQNLLSSPKQNQEKVFFLNTP